MEPEQEDLGGLVSFSVEGPPGIRDRRFDGVQTFYVQNELGV